MLLRHSCGWVDERSFAIYLLQEGDDSGVSRIRSDCAGRKSN